MDVLQGLRGALLIALPLFFEFSIYSSLLLIGVVQGLVYSLLLLARGRREGARADYCLVDEPSAPNGLEPELEQLRRRLESMMAAERPYYQPGVARNGIYLPEGTWIDYWDGARYEGPMTLNTYPAPLDKLPLFVRAGAIIPMYPEGLHDREVPKDVLIVDVYPEGQSGFLLHEDDGHNQAYRDGQWENASSGWYYDPQEKGGTIFIKTERAPVSPSFGAILDLYGLAPVSVTGPALPKGSPVRLFPNPATRTATLTAEGPATIRSVTICHPGGQQVAAETAVLHSGQWQLQFPAGITGLVLVEIILNDGRRVVKKLVMR